MTYNVNDCAEDVRFLKKKFGLVNLGENPSVGFLKEDLEGHKFIEDTDNDYVKYLMGDMSTPDQYEGHELPSSQTDNGTSSRKRKSKLIKSEENSNSQCASPRSKMRSKFREQIMKILSKPYDKQEHKDTDNDYVKYLLGDMSTPDQYEGHELPSSQTDNGTASRKRKSKLVKSEENSNNQCASPRRKMRSKFREQIMKILSKPYDKQEHKELLQAITEQKNQYRHIDLRGEEVKFCRTNKKGKSYLDHHGDLKRKVQAAVNDDHKQLNLLRGFYFWIQNLTQDESFMPWNDKECLAVQPQDC